MRKSISLKLNVTARTPTSTHACRQLPAALIPRLQRMHASGGHAEHIIVCEIDVFTNQIMAAIIHAGILQVSALSAQQVCQGQLWPTGVATGLSGQFYVIAAYFISDCTHLALMLLTMLFS